jgi:hypothetical protein
VAETILESVPYAEVVPEATSLSESEAAEAESLSASETQVRHGQRKPTPLWVFAANVVIAGVFLLTLCLALLSWVGGIIFRTR